MKKNLFIVTLFCLVAGGVGAKEIDLNESKEKTQINVAVLNYEKNNNNDFFTTTT
ncbi:hypothetical protein ACOMICROBIO_NCLOACGD_04053 [Vibrio sp. B1ASS3]|uniref:hypothetical protein n=1 Tax=Vibrio sp. B1ASS3 TaxID=2751176 RepID=UPI001ABBB6EB|nr:hypothetical protein [Vibrio sp. B1ASS3]CAD7821806.1 hypothetical protein ACOMICROBIO_NCLOACGD_04053 [Vibrio sp. B1ASS3]CAE6945990.1 hypothetical protein ACOMICROBIO_NCLOACGD_04053 [Vibrio sp. B1ASS3]